MYPLEESYKFGLQFYFQNQIYDMVICVSKNPFQITFGKTEPFTTSIKELSLTGLIDKVSFHFANETDSNIKLNVNFFFFSLFQIFF